MATVERPANLAAGALDGTLEIRELTHSDRAAVAFALRHLGERSLYQRYLVGSGPPIRREIARLTSVDHWHHEVLIAFHTHPRIPIGVAEYVRSATFDIAEIAVAIADDWQRHGVGRALAAELRRRALAAGIRSFQATALYDNRGALGLLHGLGGVERRHAGDGTIELLVSLVPEPCPPRRRALPGRPESQIVTIGTGAVSAAERRRKSSGSAVSTVAVTDAATVTRWPSTTSELSAAATSAPTS